MGMTLKEDVAAHKAKSQQLRKTLVMDRRRDKKDAVEELITDREIVTK